MKKLQRMKMAANTMDTNSNSIPEEILFEILTMLPVKSVCRFRCVSKSWLSILSNLNFVDVHLSRSKLRPKLLISVPYLRTYYGILTFHSINFYSIEYPEEHHESSSILHVNAIRHGSLINSLPSGVSSLSSASGIICFNCHQGIHIRNPITRKFNIIQYPESTNSNSARCYLGFDPIDNRQVMLKLECYPHMKSSVFTLGNWHDIDTIPPQPFRYHTHKPSICINGVIYFLVQANYFDYHTPKVYAFDVRSECFELIQHNFVDDVELLIEYKGCVTLVCSKYDERFHLKMKLWILDDPKKHRWSCKYFAVTWLDNFRGISLKVFGITHRDELIFATYELSTKGSFNLFLYEIDTNTGRRFKVCGLGHPTSSLTKIRLDFLTESLYSP